MKTAILVDGGFYRRRAQNMIGECSAEQRAQELKTNARKLKKPPPEGRQTFR